MTDAKYKKGDVVNVIFPDMEERVEITSDPIPCYYGKNNGDLEGKWCGWTYNFYDGYFFECWVVDKPEVIDLSNSFWRNCCINP